MAHPRYADKDGSGGEGSERASERPSLTVLVLYALCVKIPAATLPEGGSMLPIRNKVCPVHVNWEEEKDPNRARPFLEKRPLRRRLLTPPCPGPAACFVGARRL